MERDSQAGTQPRSLCELPWRSCPSVPCASGQDGVRGRWLCTPRPFCFRVFGFEILLSPVASCPSGVRIHIQSASQILGSFCEVFCPNLLRL